MTAMTISQRRIRACCGWQGRGGRFGLLLIVCGLSLAAPAVAQEYRIVHCLHGCPVGVAADTHLLLRPIYALSYNNEAKSADWVAYQVQAGTVGVASSLSREPREDDSVPETLQASDFEQAAGSSLILGQYAPLVNFAATPFWDDVNYLTNAVARSANLTQGAWNGLDWAIRNLANRQELLYVITGPIYDEEGPSLRLQISREHRVPDGFFKIVANKAGEVAAFEFRQDTSVGMHHCALETTVAALSDLTGLEFFPENRRPMSATLAARLGCRY